MKYAIVTGGTKGIGASIVEMLLGKNYYVVTNYAHDEVQAEKCKEKWSQISSNFTIVKADQSTAEGVRMVVDAFKAISKEIHCIVCNAGITLKKDLTDVTNEEWCRVMFVAVDSHFFIIRDLYPCICPDSRVIFIGSEMGILPHGTSLAYGVSKSAVHALARNLVKEFDGTGTTVNVVAPGFVETEWQASKPAEIRASINNKTALHRFAAPSEIASAVQFCIENQFVNGSVLEINGGYCYK